MTKNANRAEDDKHLEAKPDRVTERHGGKVVESVSLDELVSVNDADCQHLRLVRDASETEFNAFMCANPNCAIVMLYDKK